VENVLNARRRPKENPVVVATHQLIGGHARV
jgi:hypothetical protein